MIIKRHAKLLCFFSIVSLFVLPLIGRILIAGKGLPPDFLAMPFPKGPEKPGFNLLVLIAVSLPTLVVAFFVFFPTYFGFKKPSAESTKTSRSDLQKFPPWFWPGVVMTVLCWIMQWGHITWLEDRFPLLDRLTFVPLWWGFIVALDGLVYRRTDGESLLATRPRTMIALAFASLTGWYVFQYLNYFMLKNWYYPDDGLLPPWGYHLWHQIGNTTVWPAVLEWYCLLYTFDGLKKKYAFGPKFDFSKSGPYFLVTGLIFTVLVSIWPIPLFWSVWLGPSFIVGGALIMCGFWTPVTPIKRGNWTDFVLLGLAGLFNGFVWESWNAQSSSVNPSFWAYDVPFFNWMWKIGEMPLLGFSGYIPFGIQCMLWWLIFAHIFNLSRGLIPERERGNETV